MKSASWAAGVVFLLASSFLWARPDAARSSVQLGAGEVVVDHEPSTKAAPPVPDLSREQRIPIPKSVVFATPFPLLWGSSVVSPGEYDVALKVRKDYRLAFDLRARRRGVDVEVPAERADYSEPADEVSVSLAAIEGDQGLRASLLVRWGSLLFQGNFAPLVQRVVTHGNYRLTTYHFPDEIAVDRSLPLGLLEPADGEGAPRRVTLLRDGERYVVRLEREDYIRRVARRGALNRELDLLRRRARRAEDAKSYEAKIRSTEAQLRMIEKSLTKSQGAVEEISAKVEKSNSKRLSVALVGSPNECQLRVVLPTGAFVFPLEK